MLTQRYDLWHINTYYTHPVTGKRTRFRRTTGLKAVRANQKKAREMAVDAIRELERPRDTQSPEPRRANFNDFAAHWFKTYCQTRLKPSTIRTHGQKLRVHLVPAFGHLQLTELTTAHIDEYIAEKSKTLAPKTVNNHLGVLSKMLGCAVKWNFLAESPYKGIQPLKVPPSKFQFWTIAEAEVFLETTQKLEPEWYAFFLTALRTGLRQGELFALTWDHISLPDRRLVVAQSFSHGRLTTPKSNRDRTVPMSRHLVTALREHRSSLSDLVFPGRDGGYLTPSMVRRAFHRLCRAAGVPKIRFHDLRHTFASHMVMRGQPLNTVRDLLGHSDMKMTLRYAHLAPSTRQAAVDCLDEPFGHESGHAQGFQAPTGSVRD